MISRMNHVSFTVSNLDASIIFYRDVLGLSLIDVAKRDVAFSEKVTGISGAHLRIAYFSASNCFVELIEYLAPAGEKLDTRTCNVGSAHVCFDVAEYDAFIARLRSHHVHFASEPQIVPAGPNKGRKVVYAEDPDGNTLEFFSVERYFT